MIKRFGKIPIYIGAVIFINILWIIFTNILISNPEPKLYERKCVLNWTAPNVFTNGDALETQDINYRVYLTNTLTPPQQGASFYSIISSPPFVWNCNDQHGYAWVSAVSIYPNAQGQRNESALSGPIEFNKKEQYNDNE